MNQKTKFNIIVSVRIKPLNEEEEKKLEEEKSNKCFIAKEKLNQNILTLTSNTENLKTFTKFKNIIQTGFDQKKTYSLLMPKIIENFLNGCNSTVLVYGQTGMGKTHTVFGPPGCLTESSLKNAMKGIPNDWGIFPRSMIKILEHLKNNGENFSITASAVELYFNNTYDLLNSRKPVQIDSMTTIKRKKFAGGIKEQHGGFLPYNRDRFGNFVGELEIKNRKKTKETNSNGQEFDLIGNEVWPLNSPIDVAKFGRLVEATRISMGHDLNERSSRSHCIITVNLTQKKKKNEIISSKLYFVDLAGSERIKKSKSSGARKEEAANINTSLTALGRTIQELSKNSPNTYIPYRDSILTMLLKKSLGGATLTHMIICVSDNPIHKEETIASLRFGERTSLVKNYIPTKKIEKESETLESLKKKILNVKNSIEILKANGLAGGINKKFPLSTQKSFFENRKKLEESLKYQEQLKQNLFELKSCGIKPNDEKYLEIEKRRKEVVYQSEVFEGIVTRMIFSKLWIPPNEKYIQKKRELKNLKHKYLHFKKLSSDNSEKDFINEDDNDDGVDVETYMYKSLARSRFMSMGTK